MKANVAVPRLQCSVRPPVVYDQGMSSLDRGENLGRLRAGGTWDVVVVGGGATGLGAAVDAAARGYRTALLEARDFAQGTSSRSTKLIHGGVRYLAQGDIALVREALHERGVLFRNAPHLVHRRDFVVPAYRWRDLPFYGIGLKVYDVLAGRSNLGGSRWIGPTEVARRIPTIVGRGLRGGIVYTDGQFDDARLAITLARTFADLGGTALNHAPIFGFSHRDGRIAAVAARDDETGEELTIAARVVVNATGVFADAVRRLDDPATAGSPLLTPSRGTHIVLERSFLPGDSALLVPHTDDGRVLFTIPWHDRILVGTTDTPVAEPSVEPHPGREEIAYLLHHVARYLENKPRTDDVRSTFAGLRPLLRGHDVREGDIGAPTATLSREHAVVVSPSGLVTITGGKWTTYRRMGADAVDRAVEVGGLAQRPSSTVSLRLHGWQESAEGRDDPLTVYGSDSAAIRALGVEDPGWDRPLHPALPYRTAEVVWAARHEAARSVEDVLARRTRALFLDARASVEAAPLVATVLAAVLGKDAAWQEAQVTRFRELAAGYLPPPAL
jgi:glycerol-3-phosphate dehydrogenase